MDYSNEELRGIGPQEEELGSGTGSGIGRDILQIPNSYRQSGGVEGDSGSEDDGSEEEVGSEEDLVSEEEGGGDPSISTPPPNTPGMALSGDEGGSDDEATVQERGACQLNLNSVPPIASELNSGIKDAPADKVIAPVPVQELTVLGRSIVQERNVVQRPPESESVAQDRVTDHIQKSVPERSGGDRSTVEENLNSDDEMSNDCNELGSLENLLVPVTVLSTKEDERNETPRKIGKEPSGKKRNVKSRYPPLPSAPTFPTPQMLDSVKQELDSSMELTENNEEEEEDEFEDEGELEGASRFNSSNHFDPTNHFDIMAELERRLRPEIIMSVPHVPIKRTSLMLQEKVQIIKELEAGEKQSSICKRKCLAKSTVQSIWKNRVKILEASEKIGMGRKRCRRAQHENIEGKLVEWIDSLKTQNVPVNGPQLRAKAQVFARQLGVDKFRSSTGWLDKFKTRNNISFKKSPMKLTSSNASGVGDKKAAIDWVTKVWPSMCEGYSPQNIFNADEFGLFYRALPDSASKLMQESCHGGRLASERLTVFICASSDGSEKRPLTVVGSQNLIGHFNVHNLPAHYLSDPKSWMTRSIFAQELRKWDSELREASRKILLIVDNSPCHTVTESFTNIKIVFLPPIVASILQPLEHGIVEQVRGQYRRLLLDKTIRKYALSASPDKPTDIPTINILEAIVILNAAWASISTSSIQECFKNSNLQSIEVASSTTSSAVKKQGVKSTENLEESLMEKVAGFVPGFPSLSFSFYNQIDSNLHVTDYISNEALMSKGGSQVGTLTLPDMVVPSKSQVQEYLSSIRNWVMTLPVNVEERGVHESISCLENFVLKAAEARPGGVPHLPAVVASSLGLTRPQQSQLSRMMLNGLNNFQQQLPTNLIPPGTPTTTTSANNITNNNNNNNPSTTTNASTVVTFTLSDSLPQPNLPHHLLDPQQFFAYLT